ncbi:pyridoxal phosphate-dependent aminotransferase [Paenibacillus chitinolyticus]|uniref:pyridoxal phosphate-dependent aminotransferase n=1 Tax=Paenibacillus chitinolyticus TaxID=79263 RepID=UPI0035DB2A99
MIRMHLNENSFIQQQYSYYPDPTYEELRESIRQKYKISNMEILIGNGSTELISTIFLWAHLQGKKIVFPWPSYVLYQELENLYKADVIRIPFGTSEWDSEKIIKFVPENSLLILCNPNNPTGMYWSLKNIKQLLSHLPASVTVLIDEAYIEYVDISEEVAGLIEGMEFDPRCIVTRTFSKFYGLAGLRIGYAVLSSELYNIFRSYLQLWNVSIPAVEAAIACLLDPSPFIRGKGQMIKLRNMFTDIATQHEFHVLPSQTNYLCLSHPRINSIINSWENRGYLINRLLPYSDSDLNGYIRLSIEKSEIMEQLIQIIKTKGEYL